MTEQPPSIERFRVRIVPATAAAFFGCWYMSIAIENAYQGGYKWQPILFSLAGALLFLSTWFVMKRYWIAAVIVAAVAYGVLSLDRRIGP